MPGRNLKCVINLELGNLPSDAITSLKLSYQHEDTGASLTTDPPPTYRDSFSIQANLVTAPKRQGTYFMMEGNALSITTDEIFVARSDPGNRVTQELRPGGYKLIAAEFVVGFDTHYLWSGMDIRDFSGVIHVPDLEIPKLQFTSVSVLSTEVLPVP